jgi:hypothetical protein
VELFIFVIFVLNCTLQVTVEYVKAQFIALDFGNHISAKIMSAYSHATNVGAYKS